MTAACATGTREKEENGTGDTQPLKSARRVVPADTLLGHDDLP